MAVSSWPFENADTSETQYSYLMRELRGAGVAGGAGTAALQVTAGGGMRVTVAPGRLVARGFVLSVTDPETFTLPDAASTGARIDRIVARVSTEANGVSLAVLQGTPGSGVAPYLTTTDTGVFEIPLARVRVPAGATAIAAGDVTDERTWIGGDVGVWTTDTRPGTAANPNPATVGTLGLNLTTGAWEFYTAAGWANLLPAAPTWADLGGKPTTSTLDGRTIRDGDNAPAASLGVDGDIYLEW